MRKNFLFFFISAIPGQPTPAGTDEPGQGEEGGDDVEDEHAKGKFSFLFYQCTYLASLPQQGQMIQDRVRKVEMM